MGQKDITERALEAYNDIFADIVNVLLFKGKRLIDPADLSDALPKSVIKADGKVYDQERDIAKFWVKEQVRIALVGLENQTAVDKDMPLRIISYDAGEYKKQIIDKKNKMRYPIITLVLYFGNRRWKRPLSLKECFDIPKELEPYVNDYKIHVFEIPYLKDKLVTMFRSDFKVVADYFVQVRKNKKYIPSKEKVEHVNEILSLMRVLTRDDRFEEAMNRNVNKEAENMSEALTLLINEGEERGEERGREIGLKEGEARGKIIGMTESQKETARNLKDYGMDEDTIAKMVNVNVAAVREWLK